MSWEAFEMRGVVDILRAARERQAFQPGPAGILCNPFYLSRRELAAAIEEDAQLMKGRLLDVGCGTMPYKRLFTSAEDYVGMEINGSSKKADVYYDGRSFPFKDAEFDSILSTQTLEHSFHPEEFVRECARTLKPGGLFLLTVPFMWNEHEAPFDFARYSSFGLKALLERNGFEILKRRKLCQGPLAIAQLLDAMVLDVAAKAFGLRLAYLLCPPCLLPVNLAALAASSVLGGFDSFFLDNVVLASKRDESQKPK